VFPTDALNARAIPSLLHSTKIPEEVDEWGSNALHYAAEGGHADCLALLLDKCIDIQFQDHSGHTALILAAQVALE
jgi:ankyrin repeat protein